MADGYQRTHVHAHTTTKEVYVSANGPVQTHTHHTPRVNPEAIAHGWSVLLPGVF